MLSERRCNVMLSHEHDDLDQCHYEQVGQDVDSAGTDELATPLLLNTVLNTALLDTNGNFSEALDLAGTLPHNCATWCTADLAVLDDLDLADVYPTSARLPAEPSFNLDDTPLLLEGDHDCGFLVGHDDDLVVSEEDNDFLVT